MPSIFPCGNMSRAGAPVFRASEKRDALSRSEHESSRVFSERRVSRPHGGGMPGGAGGKWGFWSWRLWISRSQRDFDRINDRIRKAIRMTASWKDVRRASIPVADLPVLAELRGRGSIRVLHRRGCRLGFLGAGIGADAGDARTTDLAIGGGSALRRARGVLVPIGGAPAVLRRTEGRRLGLADRSSGRFSPRRSRQRDRAAVRTIRSGSGWCAIGRCRRGRRARCAARRKRSPRGPSGRLRLALGAVKGAWIRPEAAGRAGAVSCW